MLEKQDGGRGENGDPVAIKMPPLPGFIIAKELLAVKELTWAAAYTNAEKLF